MCSKGVPRVINLLCDHALLFGSSYQKRTIDGAIIQQVGQELHIDGMEQVEQHQSQGGFKRAKRLVLITGIASLSLLGAGFVLQPSLSGGKLREYTRSVASSLAILPPSSNVHEPPLLPQSPDVGKPPLLPQSSSVYEQPKRVQWVQPTVSYQLPTGTPLTVSLPQLQRTPGNLPVTVTLYGSDGTPSWLTFDPARLLLSGTAPQQDRGKT